MIIFIGIFLLLLGGIAVGLWAMVVKSQTPKRIATNKTPDVPFRDIVIPNGNTKLRGWFIPASSTEKQSPLIILVHGWGSGKTRMLRYVKPLYDAGYAILMFDVRSHGESDGDKAPTVKTFHDDIITAVQYARQMKDIDPNRIVLLGHSFGAFGSIIANTKSLGIRALVTDSMPTRFRTIMEASLSHYKLPYFPLGPIISKMMFIRAGISKKQLKEFHVLEAMDHQKSPVLMIHSKNDNYVPPKDLAYLLDNHKVDGTKKSYLYVESKGHRSSETDPQFWPSVFEFLGRHVNVKENLVTNPID
ncbi:alpha/beta hydrolase [Lederbergia citri]|uniref:Alpha/beta fold hydrolase n=1 Tax=Lederbergia citri TaxID=2833580 RepID=A0A942TES5_9BACI|nr:alpha/beta fold hydrolase [Lederbergia citri]MBS4196315.1 alpha/beta fold hydrolase [Lederbergia citri]